MPGKGHNSGETDATVTDDRLRLLIERIERLEEEKRGKRIELWAGKQPIAFVTPLRVRALRDRMIAPADQGGIGHAPALNVLRTLRQLFAFAERVELIAKGTNPATDFDLKDVPPRSAVWEADDDAAFDAAARDLGMPGMALAREIALYSAQREGDLLLFTEAQFQELEIFDPLVRRAFGPEGDPVWGWCFAQAKGSDEYARTAMEIPFETRLAARISSAIRDNRARDRAQDPPRLITHVLVDELHGGRPWKKRDFIKAWTRILDHAATRTGRAAMRDLTWHDLRRTRVVRLRRKGMAKEMIATITGHKPKSIEMMLKVYGPADPAMTASALASTLLEHPTKKRARAAKEKAG